MDNVIQEIEDGIWFADAYVGGVCDGMTEFQIERFLIGAEPPVGRYHQCCVEIRSRIDVLSMARKILADPARDPEKAASLKVQARAALRELSVFKKLADRYAPLMVGRRFEDSDVQSEYWDQLNGWRLAISIITGEVSSVLVNDIMRLPEGSDTRVFFEHMMSAGKPMRELVASARTYVREYLCVEDVSRPRLSAG
jgi:hypothetical protein